ncbi:hypothetical protein M404DRAFT_907811 [Pisolithus tinctorius Marx 270]|uniref:Uncharacterized protein n=1 Tax=Pisolithus tinctorius Marx 270 TaxID=870435 RepID=A0A0C3KLG2_PISTI|nr:hypothetical protein M404DRAFT_907811 [Pisolithus tinctorius Marx 270]
MQVVYVWPSRTPTMPWMRTQHGHTQNDEFKSMLLLRASDSESTSTQHLTASHDSKVVSLKEKGGT